MKTRKTPLLLTLCAGFAFTLTGCLLGSEPEDRMSIITARWASGDSVLIYTAYDQRLITKKTYSAPRIRVFQVKLDSNRKFYDHQLVFTLDTARACADLSIQDSLVVFSYYPWTEGASYTACPGSDLVIRRQGTIPLSPMSGSVDTAAMRGRLTTYELEEGLFYSGGLESPQDVCVKASPLNVCLLHQAKVWKSKHPGE